MEHGIAPHARTGEAIGGELEIYRTVRAGTEVELLIAAKVA